MEKYYNATHKNINLGMSLNQMTGDVYCLLFILYFLILY